MRSLEDDALYRAVDIQQRNAAKARRARIRQKIEDDLERRLAARARRADEVADRVNERLMKRLESEQETTMELATAKWKTAVAKLVQAGYSQSQAVSAVNRQNPGLRERMLEEANSVHRVRVRQHTQEASRQVCDEPVVSIPNAAAKWKSEVAALLARGMSRPQACSEVNRRHPGLRQSMVQQANAGRIL